MSGTSYNLVDHMSNSASAHNSGTPDQSTEPRNDNPGTLNNTRAAGQAYASQYGNISHDADDEYDSEQDDDYDSEQDGEYDDADYDEYDEYDEDSNHEIKMPEQPRQPEQAPQATAEAQNVKSEIKHLNLKMDQNGTPCMEEIKTEEAPEPQQERMWWQLYAFCLVQVCGKRRNDPGRGRLHVNTKPLRQLLKDVIGNHHTDTIDVDDVQIAEPYRCLFHYLDKIEEVGTKRFTDDDDTESLEHLHVLLNWLKKHFSLSIAARKRCIKSPNSAIEYDHVWTLFPPGTVVYFKTYGQDRAAKVVRARSDDGKQNMRGPGLDIYLGYTDFDGKRIGTHNFSIFIPKYQGFQVLTELNCMPLNLHPEYKQKYSSLLKRGRTFEKYVSREYVHYDGFALFFHEDNKYDRVRVSGRVMIDAETALAQPNPGAYPYIKPFKIVNNVGEGEMVGVKKTFPKLSDTQAVITNGLVLGYSFEHKIFLKFYCDKLKPIAWNPACFDKPGHEPSNQEPDPRHGLNPRFIRKK